MEPKTAISNRLVKLYAPVTWPWLHWQACLPVPESCCRSSNFVYTLLKEPREKEASLCNFHLRSYSALTCSVSTTFLRERSASRLPQEENWAYGHPICSKGVRRPSLWLWLILNRWRGLNTIWLRVSGYDLGASIICSVTTLVAWAMGYRIQVLLSIPTHNLAFFYSVVRISRPCSKPHFELHKAKKVLLDCTFSEWLIFWLNFDKRLIPVPLWRIQKRRGYGCHLIFPAPPPPIFPIPEGSLVRCETKPFFKVVADWFFICSELEGFAVCPGESRCIQPWRHRADRNGCRFRCWQRRRESECYPAELRLGPASNTWWAVRELFPILQWMTPCPCACLPWERPSWDHRSWWSGWWNRSAAWWCPEVGATLARYHTQAASWSSQATG